MPSIHARHSFTANLPRDAHELKAAPAPVMSPRLTHLGEASRAAAG